MGSGWMVMGATNTTPPNCPGKIECPMTGKQVCKDRCPVAVSHGPAAALDTAETFCAGNCPAPKPDKSKDVDDV